MSSTFKNEVGQETRKSVSNMRPNVKERMERREFVNYTHEILTEFIQLYRSYPCLWQVRCKGYKDRLLRNRAYDALVQKLREVNKTADRDAVIRKINTMRTAFRREFKKVTISQKLVDNPQNRYKSSLWYYDLLKFVTEQNVEPFEDVPKEENLFNESSFMYQEDPNIQTDVGKMEPPSPAPSRSLTPPDFQPVILQTEGSYSERYSPPLTIEASRKRRQHQTLHDERSKTIESIYDPSARQLVSYSTNDDFETFGHYVAGKLRRSAARQSMIAEKLISDVLLRANLGVLDENTSLSDKSSSRCFLVMGDK